MKLPIILFFFVMTPLCSIAMDEPFQKHQQEELLKKIAELRKKVDKPNLYDNCAGVLLHKFDSPIKYLDFIASKIRQDPTLQLKDIQCGGKPMIELLQSETCTDVFAFMLEHGCQKPS